MPKIITRAEAKALGLKRYFTGEPCKHGHVCERTLASRCCLMCSLEIQRRYRAANAEKCREAVRRYRAANLEKVNEKARRHRATSAYREHVRQRRAANIEKARAYERRYRAANPEKKRGALHASWRAFAFMRDVLMGMGLIKKEDTPAEQRGFVRAYVELGLISKEEIEAWLNTKTLKKA
jgi:hypothetical protein